MTPISTDDPVYATANRKSRLIGLKRIAWPVVYIVSLALIFSWYEFGRPALFARKLHGSWQKVNAALGGDESTNVHMLFDGDESWLVYPGRDVWELQRSRISVRPSRDFFHVTLEAGFDSRRNPRTVEYFLYKRNDQLYILRGIAKFDPIRLPTIDKLVRVDDIPDKAKEAISMYLEKLP